MQNDLLTRLLKLIDADEILVMDWETYWSSDFTLSSLPTSEYVRDDRFLSHGVGVHAATTGERHWLTGEDETGFIASVNWDRTAMLGHNTYFDGFILHELHAAHPCFYFDTRSMSRAVWGVHVSHHLNDLGVRCGIGGKEGKEVLVDTKGRTELTPEELERMGHYCLRDVDVTWQAFLYLLGTMRFPKNELFVIDYSLRAFCQPVLQVDEALARAELDEEIAKKKTVCEREGVTREDLLSNPKFAQLLFDRGLSEEDLPTKISKATGERTFAFAKSDEEFVDLQQHPVVGSLVEARLIVKSTIQETKAARLLNHGVPGPLPILLNYWAALTGRWGGGDKLNPQNFPAGRKGQTTRLRNAIVAPPGYVLVRCDSSQIEPRFLSWLADDTSLLDVFRDGRDPYLHAASEVYDTEMTDPEKHAQERQLGKVYVIALGYGMSLNKMMITAKMQFGLDLSYDVGSKLHAAYRSNKAGTVVRLWNQLDSLLGLMATPNANSFDYKELTFSHERITMSNGLGLHYPKLRTVQDENRYYYHTRRGFRSLYGAKMTENIVQSETRNIVAEQTIPIAERYQIVLLSHDEVVALVPEDEATFAAGFMEECMSSSPDWAPGLPLAAKAVISKEYGK